SLAEMLESREYPASPPIKKQEPQLANWLAAKRMIENLRGAAKWASAGVRHLLRAFATITARKRGAIPGTRLPEMTNYNEQEYLRQYASKTYSGAGDIVDLGCWLGATTIALAQGLAENRKGSSLTTKIHAYDLFVWQTWMDRYADQCTNRYHRGESFLGEFEQRT